MSGGSVLFLMGSSGVGGVERVSVVLANELVSRGFRVTFCAFRYEECNLVSGLDTRVKVVRFKGGWLTARNCRTFRQILVERQVTHVVNQWCVPFGVTVFCRWAARGLGIRLLSVHHNLPTVNKRIQNSFGVMRWVWKVMTAVNLRLVYEFSDVYVLLSDSFVDLFKRFIWRSNVEKVRVITNPLTKDTIKRDKENLIIYVGRLEEIQKRFSRVLDIWKYVSRELSDWRLEVVGDGPDREHYEKDAIGLERISFKGFQDPAEYYARARLLLLTSEFEGVPLVLMEAMASGCVPVVLGSYPAAFDVAKAGVVMPMPYTTSAFVEKVVQLARDVPTLIRLRDACLDHAKKFDVGAIADSWCELFSQLKGDR